MLDDIDYRLTSSQEVLLTSEQGDRLASKSNIVFINGKPKGNVIRIQPDVFRQTLIGIGTSFTESSAFVLAHLEPSAREEVMRNIFSAQGANFSVGRTPIGSCDFCVEGRYSYDDVKDDADLQYFDIAPDRDGFNAQKYPGIKDETFDLLPMIQQAIAIKKNQDDRHLRILASAWTAPAWMKDIDDWYIPGNAANNYNGAGGELKKQYEVSYADYMIKYLDAYQKEGVEIWGVTPVNEPLGNSGQWESMKFTPASQRYFIRDHLGPKLQASKQNDVKIVIYDHSRDQLEQWADVIYADPECAKYVDGAAVHWYESTYKVFENVFDRVHDKYPGYSIIHSEGCIDDLGKDAPEGVLDPEGYKESGWFDNDDFWWNENATDWAYTVTWPGVNAEDHPKYTPVHRYARNIIVSLDHWVTGWIDWNIVLDQRGGPNHVGNYCGAPIMIDTSSGYVYYTPIFYILAQLSRTIRPGDRAVQTKILALNDVKENVYACATINDGGLLSIQILNTSKQPVDYSLQLGQQYASAVIDANALQTIRIQIP